MSYLSIRGIDLSTKSPSTNFRTMMLRHLGLDSHANQIADSVYKVIQEGTVRTADMGGKSKTHDFTNAVISNF